MARPEEQDRYHFRTEKVEGLNTLLLWLKKLLNCQALSSWDAGRHIPVSFLKVGTMVTSEKRGLVMEMLRIFLGEEEVGGTGLSSGM